MTYLESDLDKIRKSNRKEIVNANGVSSQVMGSGIINVTGSLCLKDTILVPSLTTKLISVGRLVEYLNYMVLMYLNFCIFQDILMKEILGRGIKWNELYHLEDLNIGSTCLAGRSTQKDSI
jgi:hypothetical protein